MKRVPRRGLSTLEMVMALPILLMVMALMVNYGTLASWKVRGLSVARHQLWSQREGHAGSGYSATQYWPQDYQLATPPAVVAGSGGSSVAELNAIESNDGANLPVARGPTVGDSVPAPAQPFIVNQDLLDPARGLREGNSTAARRFPMLKQLGSYSLRSATQLFDGPWSFSALGCRDNGDFRVPHLYTVPTTVDPVYALNYIQAVAKIYYASFQAALWPLDKDDEFIKWKSRFPLVPTIRDRGYDFIGMYGSLSGFCSLDETDVQNRVNSLVDRIQGTNGQTNFAEHMRHDFYEFFGDVIDALNNELNATPPPPPDVQAQLQQEINDLKAEQAQLEGTLN